MISLVQIWICELTVTCACLLPQVASTLRARPLRMGPRALVRCGSMGLRALRGRTVVPARPLRLRALLLSVRP
jgi:hypothetical protein